MIDATATPEDQAITQKWAFDPRYTDDLSDMWRSKEQLPKDMQTSVAARVMERIEKAQSDGAELEAKDPGLFLGMACPVYRAY